MLNDRDGKKFYYQKALSALDEFEAQMKREHESGTSKMAGSGLLLFGGSLAAAFLAPMTIPVAIGIALAGKASILMMMMAKDDEGYAGIENEACPELEYTGEELRKALRAALSAT
jgi:hypothetical protein